MNSNQTGRTEDHSVRIALGRIAGSAVGHALGRIEVLALFPLIALTASWLGFDDLPMVTAVGLSVLLAIGVIWGRSAVASGVSDTRPVAPGRAGLLAMLDRVASAEGRDTACLLLQIDDWPATVDLWGHDASEEVIARIQDRIQTALRDGDLMTRLGDARFGIVLGAVPSARMGLRDTIAERLAGAVAEPIGLRGATLRLTACIGHSALIRRGTSPAETTFKAAEAALSDAMRHGPGATRAYAPGMGRSRSLKNSLGAEVEGAVHQGAISAWFQPTVCARTGVLTGAEVLARWDHPKQGLLGPTEFLPAAAAAGQMPLLGQSLMHQALKSFDDWDKVDAHVPEITLNVSADELRDTRFVESLRLERERYNLDAPRIRVELTQAAATKSADDAVVATLDALRAAGHPIDLDDFGFGPVSLATLQRFGISRLKIDRSFVLGIDADDGNRKAVAAIVAMAQALDIETVAKGVETAEEADTMVELGCDYLQGFHIARPMRGDRVADWARARRVSGKTIRLEDRRNA